MSEFIGRKNELKALQSKFDKPGFKMAIIYGRRRIGKTALINRFINNNDCKSISFVALERTEKELLKLMSDSVLFALAPEMSGTISFESFEKLFDFIAAAAKTERIIFFIDEYPYLATQVKYINSLLQKYVDHDWKNSNLFFIICGSLVGFMRDEVIGESAPLHGRSDLEIKLRPFDYKETGLFLPGYSAEEKAIVYGLSSGVAKYIEQFDDKISLDENIEREFFNSDGYFTEEQVKSVISSDKQNPAIYNSIIAAIASGHTKYSEISSCIGGTDINYYMKMLTASEVIERRVSKKPYYILNDGMLNFWFRYVSDAASLINAGRGYDYFKTIVKPAIHSFMGKIFEEMAKQYLFEHSGIDGIPLITSISDYQTSVKTEDGKIRQIEIDLLGSIKGQNVLAGECKFKETEFDKESFDTFIEKTKYIPAVNPQLVLFSLNGFSKYVKEKSKGMGIKLVKLKDMYK